MLPLDQWIARSSDGTTLLIVVAVAAALGLRHATDPDHLAAVTALIATGDDHSARGGSTARLRYGVWAMRRHCSSSGCRSSSSPHRCPSPSSRRRRPPSG